MVIGGLSVGFHHLRHTFPLERARLFRTALEPAHRRAARDDMTTVEAKVTFLAPEQDGRQLGPLLDNQRYRPHLRVPPDPSMLGVEFVAGPEGQVPFGAPVLAALRLVYESDISYAALRPGCRFEILEGARMVGYGTVVQCGELLST